MDNLQSGCWAVWRGAADSLRGTFVLFSLDSEMERMRRARVKRRDVGSGGRSRGGSQSDSEPSSRVMLRVGQCCALNGGVFLTSIVLFYWCVLPALQAVLPGAQGPVWLWTARALALLFQCVWVVPLFALSKLVNGLWFQDVADWSYRYSSGARSVAPRSLSRLLADQLASALVQTLFLGQAHLASCLPLHPLADALYLLHAALLYSLYAFEYRWYHMGWELHRRLAYLEAHWPYFLGFGLPLAAATHCASVSSWLVGGCLFSLLFPLFIISGNEATVTNCPPSLPSLPIFHPVVSLSNALFTHCTSANSSKIHNATSS